MDAIERDDAPPEYHSGVMGPVEEVSTVHNFMLAALPTVLNKCDQFSPEEVANLTFRIALCLTAELARFRRETFKTATQQEADPESYPQKGKRKRPV